MFFISLLDCSPISLNSWEPKHGLPDNQSRSGDVLQLWWAITLLITLQQRIVMLLLIFVSPIDLYSSIRINYVCDVEYIMGLARIIFNKLNKTLWYVTLSVVWFHTIRDFD